MILIIVALITLASGQVSVSWLSHSGMVTGSKQIIAGAASVSGNTSYLNSYITKGSYQAYNTYEYNVNFGKTISGSPDVCLGIISMQMANGFFEVEAYHDWMTVSSSSYTHQLIIPPSLKVVEQTIMFLVYDTIAVDFISVGWYATSSFSSINWGSGYRSDSRSIGFANGRSFDLSHTNALFVWMTGFDINQQTSSGGTLDIAIFASLTSSVDYNLTFATRGTTCVYYAQYNRMFFDITLVQTTQENFFDIGTIEGKNSAQTVWPTMVNYISTGFFGGTTNMSFAMTGTTQAQFKLSLGSFNITSTSGYNYIKLQFMNFRVRSCVSPNVYYYQTNQMCYTTCPVYTYLNTTYNFCYGCNYACYTCTDPNAASCTSCDNTTAFRNLTTGQCTCLPGYYDAGVQVCATCQYTCLTCDGPTNISCLTCGPTRTISLGICVCNNGTYDSGTAICSSCDYSCKSCLSGGTGCKTCPTTRTLSGTLCPCNAGLYDAGVATCVACNYTCLNCTGTSTNCTACVATRVLTSNACPCVNGRYDNAVSTCALCNATCATCTTGAVCTACVSPNATPSGTICVCNSGFYAATTTTCVACPVTCLSCTSLTMCTSCNTTNNFVLTSGACKCATGYYLDTGTNTCLACNATLVNCAQCNVSTSCAVCVPPNILVAGRCGCLTTQYMNNSVCIDCTVTLQGCTACTNSTDCTSCDTASNWQLSGTTCSCVSTALFISANTTCTVCSTLMTGCSTCSASSVCTTCISPQFTLDGSSCVCTIGYYPSGTDCLACDPTCVTCSGPLPTDCLSCNTAIFALTATNSCACFDGTYLVAPASCSACYVSCATCNAGTYSDCLTCAAGLTLTTNQCLCSNSSEFYNGSACVACYGGCTTCFAGLSTNCLTCTSPATLNSSTGACDCPIGTFINGTFQCQACDPTCTTCLGSPTNCTTCTAPLNFISGTCICNSNQYMSLTSGVYSCPSCNIICTTCSGGLGSDCTSCTMPLIINGTTCICSASTYVDPMTGNCLSCDPTCFHCSGPAATDCTSCDASLYRILNGTSCPCNMTALEVGVPLCQFVGCPTGYLNVSDVCVVICGDGILLTEQCDDGNTNSGDGCSSICESETNYTCSSQSPSICSYNQPLSLNLLSTVKSLTANQVQFTVQFGPAIPALADANWSQMFSTNLSGTNLTYTYLGNGVLVIDATYNSSIQGLNASVNFDPLLSNSPYFQWTPSCSANFTVDPNNNLAAEYYDDSTYSSVGMTNILAQALQYSALAGFAAGLVMAKFIGIELIGVVQVAFIGLMTINYLQPMLAPMAKIGFVNGVNTMFQNQTVAGAAAAPNRVTSLQYEPEMIVNLNYTTLLLVLPLLAGLVLFIVSKIWKSKSETLLKYSMVAVCEYGFTAVMFVLYHMIVSLMVYVAYATDGASSELFPYSIAECVATVGVSIAVAVLFNLKPQYFGDYKTAFQPGDKFAQNYYYVLMAGRVLVAVILVGANSIQYVGFIATVVPIAGMAIIAVKKPYLHPYNNYRAAGNEAVTLVVLASYGYYRSFVDYTNELSPISALLPYVDIGLLLLCVLANIAIMGKFQYDKCKASKESDSKAKQEQYQQAQKEDSVAEKELIEEVKTRFRNMSFVKRPTLLRPSITPKNFDPQAPVAPPKPDEPLLETSSPLRPKLEDKLLTKPKTTLTTVEFGEQEVLEIMNGFDAI